MFQYKGLKKAIVAGMVLVLSASLCEAEIPVDRSIQPVQLSVNTRYFWDGDKEDDLLWSSKTLVSMVGSGKEKGVTGLQDRLWQYGKDVDKQYKDIRASMLDAAKQEKALRKEYQPYTFYPFEHSTDVYIRRADTVAASLLEFSHSYEGGVHGMYGVRGKNYDSKSGKELSLTDVFTDANMLVGAIETQLRRDYPKATFTEEGSTLLEDTVSRMVLDDVVSWTLDPCGATFYFNPYVIGCYAEGIFNATILFDDYPGLFKEKYASMPANYCMELYPYLPVRTCFADGSSTAVEVSGTDSGIRVMAGGQTLVDSGYNGELRPVLVSLADGRRYLYVDAVEEGEQFECTRVYDISNGAPVAVPLKNWLSRRENVPADFKKAKIDKKKKMEKNFYIMSNPDGFFMTVFDEESGKTSKGIFKVGADGKPVELSK
ncbi:RsiV family protein [Anaerovibrio sp. RM50]|uniref:RsiV family protein n=1 Tax=Anaerovibrio sp. RM50 TaxID=1200557 RepID=UPI000482F4A3|nr:RsiV family protein [Anaerovibrio sp. RM50]